ncbi:MAG: hypothetical protein HKL95_10825 [Phycisphaerae bacterium]|nr:hypothetical protein [Phycisphaerae bacterium]
MYTQRHLAARPDIPPELVAFMQRCRRSIFWGELADGLLPTLGVAALVILVMLLARGCWLSRPLVAVLLVTLSLAGLALGMKRLSRLKRANLTAIIAAMIGLLAWLLLPPWALVVTVAGVCAGLVVWGMSIKSVGETAWMVDVGNGADGVLLTAVGGASAVDPVECLFRQMVQQRALRMIPSVRCPAPFDLRRKRMVAAATGVAGLGIGLILLLGPPTARPWQVSADMRAAGPVLRPAQPLSPGGKIRSGHVTPNRVQSLTGPRRRNSKPSPSGNAASHSGSSTGRHGGQSRAAAAAEHELLSNSTYRKMAAGAVGTSAGSQGLQDFSRLTERQKRHLAATIRRAEKKVLHDPKLLAGLQKLAVAASGSSAAAFSTALEQTRKMLQARLGLAGPTHTQPVRSTKPGFTNSSRPGSTGAAGENSSGITPHAPPISPEPETGLSSSTSGDVTVLHAVNARGSGNFAAALENSKAEQRIGNVPEQYRYLIRRYFAHGW